MANVSYNLRKYFSWSSHEWLSFLITVVVVAFLLSFNNWGADELDVNVGIENLAVMVFSMVLLLGVIILVQKMLGIFLGYSVTYESSWLGLGIGLFVTILTNGILPFFLPGGLKYDTIPTRRIGKFLPGHNHNELFVIAAAAPLVPLLLAIPFGALYLATGVETLKLIIFAALFTSVYSLIPFPNFVNPGKLHGPTDITQVHKLLHHGAYGYDLWSFNMPGYAVLVATVLVFSALVLLLNVFSLVVAFVLGLLMLWIYKITVKYLTK